MFRSWPTRRGTAAAAVVTALAIALGSYDLALGCFGLVLVCCYAGSLYLHVASRFILAAGSAALASIPWFGIGYFAYPPTGELIVGPMDLPWFLNQVLWTYYFVAEAPPRAVLEISEATNSIERWHLMYSVWKGVARVDAFAVFVFWSGVALAFALSGLTWVLAKRVRNDRSPIRWMPVLGLPVLLRNAGVVAAAIFLSGFALWAVVRDLSAKGIFYRPGLTIDEAFQSLPLAAYLGLVVAYQLRAPLPKIFNSALWGAALGLALALDFDWLFGYRDYLDHIAGFGLAMPAGVIVGAATGAILYRLRNKAHLAAKSAANG